MSRRTRYIPSIVPRVSLGLLIAGLGPLVALSAEGPKPRVAAEEGTAQPVELGDALVVEPLEPKLWLFRATEVVEPWGPISSNGLIAVGADGAWVIDTPWSDEQTDRLLDWVEAEVGTVLGVVATHFHHDRLGGVAAVHQRSLPTWGHADTARLAATVELEPPRRTFTEAVELATGSEALELFYPGPAHTVDNTVVWFPERKLLYGGCMIKSARSKSAGNLADADLAAWPASLEAIADRYPEIDVVVPGHGAVGTGALLERTRQLVEAAASARER